MANLLLLMVVISKVTSVEKILLDNENGKCLYYPDFIPNIYTQTLIEELSWDQSEIKIFGKLIPIPRLNAWYADPGVDYSYSGYRLKNNPWTPLLLKLKKKVEDFCQLNFNSCLINYYRDGSDYVSWHSDDEPELGPDPFIATLSFGSTRNFEVKENNKKLGSYPIDGGSLVITCDGFHNHFKHQISKTKRNIGPRISLTFRIIE